MSLVMAHYSVLLFVTQCSNFQQELILQTYISMHTIFVTLQCLLYKKCCYIEQIVLLLLLYYENIPETILP